MARKLVVEIVGDASSLTKTYKQATYSTKAFGVEVDKATRGVLSGSGALRGFGRSLAFASGGFLAFEGVTSFLEGSVTAARDAAVSQRALAAQMKTSGESFAASRDQIEKAGLSLSRFGFTSEDADQALVVLDRGTGSLHKSIGLLGLTADLARAKNLSFAASANIVAKVFGGQTTALRRAVPGLDANAKGWDLIREAQAKLAGQAAAGTTVNERFSATLHETQRIIGEGLLPVLNEYLGQLTKWLDKMNRSGKLQKDVNKFVKDATPIFHDAGVAIGGAADALGRYQGALDGLRKASSGNWLQRSVADTLRVLIDPGYGLGKVLSLFGGKGAGKSGLANLTGPVGTSSTLLAGLQGVIGTPGGKLPPGATVGQRNAWFDAMIARDLDRVQDLPSLKAQIARLHEISGLVTARVAVTKDITRKLNLEDQVRQIARQVRADQEQLDAKDAADAKAAAEKAKKIADEIAKANKARLDALNKQLKAGQVYTATFQKGLAARAQANQYLALGLTRTGEDRAPSRGNLRAELKKVQEGLKGTILDTDPNRNLVARIRKVLGSQFDSLTRETRLKVKELLDALTGDNRAGPATARSAASISQLIAGTGLGGAALRRLEFNLAGAHLTTMPVGPGGRTIHVHTTVNLDGKEIARNTTTHQERDSRRRPTQTRGRQTNARSL